MNRFLGIVIVLGFSVSLYAQSFQLSSKDSLNGQPKNIVTFGGFVNTIFYYDFVGINNAYPALNVAEVPVGKNVFKEPYLNFNAFQTRLKMNSKHQTKIGLVKLYVEGDYVSGTGAFRLRHALISVNKWDIGQTWSNFSDEDMWPNMTDYDGPPTGIWARHTMIRYNAFKGEKNSVSLSMEGPSLDYTYNYSIDSNITTTNQNIPDFTARYRYESEKLHFQLSGVYRNIRYKNISEEKLFYETGYGISMSTSISVFGRDKFHIQATTGKGISRYMVGFEGRNWDAIPTGQQNIELLPTYGGFVGYDHYWNKKKTFSSTLVAGGVFMENNVLDNVGDFMEGYWGLVNLYWYPAENLSLAIEYVGAYRKDYLGLEGYADRVQLMVQYSF